MRGSPIIIISLAFGFAYLAAVRYMIEGIQVALVVGLIGAAIVLALTWPYLQLWRIRQRRLISAKGACPDAAPSAEPEHGPVNRISLGALLVAVCLWAPQISDDYFLARLGAFFFGFTLIVVGSVRVLDRVAEDNRFADMVSQLLHHMARLAWAWKWKAMGVLWLLVLMVGAELSTCSWNPVAR
jgi:hypothetical protein